MEKRAVKRVLKVIGHELYPDERIDHVCRAGVVPPSKEHYPANAAMVAAGAAAAAVLGGGMVFTTQARRYFLVLTDRRLLFVDMDMAFARPLPNVRFVLPRHGLGARRVSSFPSGKIALHDPEGQEICVLFFPLGVRLDGANLLKHLTQAPVGTPG
jgi:hypothetical protein